MIEALKDLLIFNEKSGSPKWNYETLNLLEGIGNLVGHMPPGSLEQANVMKVSRDYTTSFRVAHTLQLILGAPTTDMANIFSNKLWLQESPENPAVSKQLCDLILAIGTFSKGFPLSIKNSNENVKKYFSAPLNMILEILEVSPDNQLIRAKAIFFLHRFVLRSSLLTLLEW